MSGAAVILLRQKRYIERFKEAGAIDTAHARALDELGCRDSWIFRRMEDKGVFARSSGGRYYVDVDAADKFLRSTRRRVFVITGVLLIIFLLWFM